MILASKSPRRKELLTAQGFDFEIIVSDFDESTVTETDPEKLVLILAEMKGRAIAEKHPDEIVISADTVVALDGVIFGKPKNEEDAFRMLRALSGRKHTVFTGISVSFGGKTVTECEASDVYFRDLDDGEILSYIKSGEPMDKAGAYGIQGRAAGFVSKIDGDWASVVGLPVCRLVKIMKCGFGINPDSLRKCGI